MNIAEIKARAEAALAADKDLRGPYTLGTPKFLELTNLLQDFRGECGSPENMLALIKRVDEVETGLDRLSAAVKEKAPDIFMKDPALHLAVLVILERRAALAMKAPAKPEYKQEFDGG